MRVVFMGTPEFAVPTLRALDRAHEVAAVYTRPDAVSGRGAKTRPSAVKAAALELGIEVRQPRTLRDEAEVEALRELQADVIVVAAYGLILPLDVLKAARAGAINVHASLLPRWRGAAPIQRAILEGDTATGVSIMRMEEGLDTGPYCLQVALELDDLTAGEATSRLAELGAVALVDALPAIVAGTAEWTAQDDRLVTYADKIGKDDVALSPDLAAQNALRRIRASGPTAPARIRIAERGLTVIAAHAAESRVVPGGIDARRSGLVLGFSDAAIEVTRVKPEGKGEMEAAAWARGVRDIGESRWESAR
jgi:methionyl-tRNA formyltransferase